MNRITVQIIAGAILLALQSVAADRLTLSTHVPSSAAHLPMLERLPATNRLELAIALPLRNQDVLANLARQIYDRRNTNFHCYLTPAQFAAQFGPKVGDYQKVLDYVRSNRMEVLGTYNNRALVDVAGSVADIEKMFQVHLGTYQHPTESRQFFGPDKPPSVDSDCR
jgi:kumamolisin